MNRPKDAGKRDRYLLGAAAAAGALCVGGALLRRAREIDLAGSVVLITGGSRGLGLVLARQLADQGARLAICARDPEELKRAREELEARGAEVLAVACDVSRPDEVDRLVATVHRDYGAIDGLINSAGVIQVGPMEDLTRADFEEALNVNFWGAYNTTMAALPDMRERGRGRIVNIGSIGGKVAVPHFLSYTVSKFAVVGFSQGLRAELAKDGIRVTTVCPGMMRTGSHINAVFKGQHQKEYAAFSILNGLPLFSVSAETAARRIITAMKRGDAELMFPLPAEVATCLYAVFPGLGADVLAAANRVLPEPGGIGTDRASGKESWSEAAPSILTARSDRASVANNEI